MWETTFKVVGPIYLDGVMDGEAFLGQLPDPWRVQYNISSTSVSDKVLYKNHGGVLLSTQIPVWIRYHFRRNGSQ